MSDLPVLTAPALVLRPPHPSDTAARRTMGHDPHMAHMFGGDPDDVTPMTEADAAAWYQRMIAHPMAWVVDHDGDMLGHVRLDGLDRHDSRARLAIGFFDPAKLSQGIGRRVIRLVLSYAFGELKQHRLSVRVVSYNARAIRCYQACGFVVEGVEREREAACAGGARHDDIRMGILASEWL